MNKRTRILLFAVLALIICALGLVIYLSHEPPEPTYNGKPLSFWLAGYDAGNYKLDHPKGPPPPTWKETDDAIKAMGTNAIPALLPRLKQHDSKFKTTVWRLLHWQHFFNVSFIHLGQDFVASRAITTLGSNASPALPDLIHIYETDYSSFGQQSVPAIMSAMGPPARPAIPMLLHAITHTNEIVRNNAIHALGMIGAEPGKVVPALMKCLNDPDAHVQAQAIETLGRFGTNAQSAVPVLVEMLRRELANPSGKTWHNFSTSVSSMWNNRPVWATGPSSPPFSNVLRDALNAIDSDAVAKAGIKPP